MSTEASGRLHTFITVSRRDVEDWLWKFESQLASGNTEHLDLYDLLKTGRAGDGTFIAHYKVIDQMFDALFPENRRIINEMLNLTAR